MTAFEHVGSAKEGINGKINKQSEFSVVNSKENSRRVNFSQQAKLSVDMNCRLKIHVN